ncbi:T9SS type A sorting domain-containing protein [Chryseobacterium profundimaris]|uniref:Por secretion system C-terminal sorting domain-containing protein n=1 Tax=Chryseobacterium profundimaris TaxID=1387275 RepID=A0ABY1PIQ7_9FLAO|nr:T9SS type A sorting domain-containing protein [Chryseobacterium profundimaris]SMP35271.1 Por secretion system C-terminal sorting domain-containing protein [Chryseobacterium profundimaris]
MNKHIVPRIPSFLILFFSISAFSQLTKSDHIQLWEKIDHSSKESGLCADENLLNFHCGIKDKVLEKIIKYSSNKDHTISLVHQSKENELIWLDSRQNISLSNTFYNNKDRKIEIAKRPSIFSFIGKADSDKNKIENPHIKFEDHNLYELIFIQKKAKTLDLNKIHSYLSIKYGISLEKRKYYSSDGKVIWDPDKHKDYKYRPTGLGRDDGNELYQKQSTNQEDQFLTIGMNEIKRTNSQNITVLDDNNFVIWSDDNKSLSLKNDGKLDVLERNWEINFIGKFPKTNYQIKINKEIINPNLLPLSYWMLIKKENGEIIQVPGIEDNKHVIFKAVEFLNAFDSGNITHFTFAASPRDHRDETNLLTNSNSGNYYNENGLSLDLNTISLYPNPVKKGQNFTITFPPMDNLIISVYDSGGRLVFLEKISNKLRQFTSRLPAQSSYIITLTQQGKIIKTFKLIVD